MILAASFSGEMAEGEALALVRELRSTYGLQAYLHEEKYDYTQPIRGRGIDRYGNPKTMRHQKSDVVEEIAVLIGDFPTVDDPRLQKTLRAVKYTHPKSLRVDGSRPTSLRFAGLRSLHRKLSGKEEKQKRGPMGNAFATRNPLLPREFFAPQGIDSVVMSMNKDVKHSLLNCPGKYSVRVATFRGNVILDQREIQEIESKDVPIDGKNSKLAAAAEKAHRLVLALRKQGIEAYEFHDKFESYVTVGSFDWVSSPREDEKEEINPAIHRVMLAYGPKKRELGVNAGQMLAGLEPRSLNGIPFDVQPIPVAVPKRSIAADYVQSR
jgi:hypothetical protein